MLIRRVARPMLVAVFIGEGLDALRSPKLAADAARPTLQGVQKLPDPVGGRSADRCGGVRDLAKEQGGDLVDTTRSQAKKAKNLAKR